MQFLTIALVALPGAAAIWLWTPDRGRAVLEARYSRGPADFVEVAGLRLHVRDEGPRDAPAVVLLHGFGSSLQTWDDWAATLADDHRVVRFDLPGAGLTGPDPTGDYGDERAVAVLEALLARLAIDRATVIGNSLGGRMAWKFAAARPARVDKLVLIAPDGFESPGFEYGKAPRVPAVLSLMRYVLPKALLRANLGEAYSTAGALTPDLVRRYHDMMRAPGVRGALLERMAQTVLEDPVPILRRIEAPTLLLWGEDDAMIPVRNVDDYDAALADSTVCRLDGVGHVPHEEAPVRSLEPVLRFLGRPQRGSVQPESR